MTFDVDVSLQDVLEISVKESADKAEHLAIKWFIRGKRKRKFRPILHVDGS